MPDNSGADNERPFQPQGIPAERKLPFVCLGSECPNTCCGPFHGTRALHAALTPQDLGAALGEASEILPSDRASIFAQIRLTPEDVERLQSAGLDHLIVRRGSMDAPHYYLRLKPDGTCTALAPANLCSIHPHRPTLCRAFPFYIDLFAGLTMVSSCPGVGAGEQTVEELREEITAATAMYRYWLRVLEPD
jgi:Fe-S-cluster containining protein